MWIVIFITVAILLVLIRLVVVFQDKIKFFVTGQDEGFRFSEINLLWKLAKKTEIEVPSTLFYSVPVLNQAITQFIANARQKDEENSPRVQDFLTKLYAYRTKVDISHDNKRGLESSKYLDKGQRLRIILKGRGVFASEILNNGHEIVIRLPLQKNTIKMSGEEWVGNDISVYLWRKGDASYVFDTRVTNSGVFNGQNVIYLAQSNKMERTQKRRSVRSECKINGHLYFIDVENLDFTQVEVEEGYKCLIEDISEDGAMIRVGGKGQNDVQIKIQFELEGKVIVMFGIVRSVEYNAKLNQSRLHFECIHIEKEMRVSILNYVYKIIPDDKKEVLEALSQTEEDERADKAQEQAEEIEAQAAIKAEERRVEAEKSAVEQEKKYQQKIDETTDISELDVSDDF